MARKKTVDTQMIKELAGLLEETGLSELEIEQDGLRIKVARHSAVAVQSQPTQVAAPAQAKTLPGKAEETDSAVNAVKSPMVGTVYRSPEPGAKPFIEVGSKVAEGQTCLIIEAMKTMNPIPAPCSGTVSAILVNDSSPVEFGEPLFILE
jgi:acetyl-CoA carboxylase biotin carboxyl carrier protein